MNIELTFEKLGFKCWYGPGNRYFYISHKDANYQHEFDTTSLKFACMPVPEMMAEYINSAIKFGMREARDKILGKIENIVCDCIGKVGG